MEISYFELIVLVVIYEGARTIGKLGYEMLSNKLKSK